MVYMEHLIKSVGTIDLGKQEKYEVDTTGVKTVNKVTFTLNKKEFTEFKDAYETFTYMSSKPEFLKIFRDIHGQDATRSDLNEKLIRPFEYCMASIAKKRPSKKHQETRVVDSEKLKDGFYTKKYKPTQKYIEIAKAIELEVVDEITIPMVNSALKKYSESDKFSMKFFGGNPLVVDAESFKDKSILVTISKEIIGFVAKGN